MISSGQPPPPPPPPPPPTPLKHKNNRGERAREGENLSSILMGMDSHTQPRECPLIIVVMNSFWNRGLYGVIVVSFISMCIVCHHFSVFTESLRSGVVILACAL